MTGARQVCKKLKARGLAPAVLLGVNGSAIAPPMVAQFLRFGTVGVFGFLIDTATVYAVRGALGLYGAGLLAYLLAASATWALNRAWTFRERASDRAAHQQWLLFLGANLLGFALNRGTFAALVTFVPACASEPVLAVAAGALAGMFVNFGLNRAVVFPAPR